MQTGKRLVGAGLAGLAGWAGALLGVAIGAAVATGATAVTLTQLTTGVRNDLAPSWSPDGTQIAFTRLDDVYVVPAAGGEPINVTNDPVWQNDREHGWSPDGTRIAYVLRDDNHLEPGYVFVIPATGGEPEQLTFQDSAYPSWSPDGNSILFASGAELLMVPASGGHVRRVPGGQFVPLAVWPRISPDGSTIVVANNVPFSEGSTLFRLHVSGGTLRQLITNPGDDTQPSWSPDGTRIAFASRRGSTVYHLWVASDLETTGVEPSTWTRVKHAYR